MTQAHPYRDRVAALRRAIADQGAAAMVVSDPMNVRYLSGFTGSNGSLAVLADRVVLVTDGRYLNQAAARPRTSTSSKVARRTTGRWR